MHLFQIDISMLNLKNAGISDCTDFVNLDSLNTEHPVFELVRKGNIEYYEKKISSFVSYFIHIVRFYAKSRNNYRPIF